LTNILETFPEEFLPQDSRPSPNKDTSYVIS